MIVQLLFSFIFAIRKYLSLDSSYNINIPVLLVIMSFKLVCKKVYSSYDVYLYISI